LKDVIKLGSVTGILPYFSSQLSFPGASIKFQEISRSDFKFQGISRFSRSCKHPDFRVRAQIIAVNFPTLAISIPNTAEAKGIPASDSVYPWVCR